MNFDEYLVSKKIDSEAFRTAEPSLWATWKGEFEQMSPASFTAQKLYLINPVRRKYQGAFTTPAASTQAATESPAATTTKPAVAKPMFKPRVPGAAPTPPPAEGDNKTSADTAPETATEVPALKPAAPKPAIPRPVMKPKPAAPAADVSEEKKDTPPEPPPSPEAAKPARPVIPRPVIKPKPKID